MQALTGFLGRIAKRICICGDICRLSWDLIQLRRTGINTANDAHRLAEDLVNEVGSDMSPPGLASEVVEHLLAPHVEEQPLTWPIAPR